MEEFKLYSVSDKYIQYLRKVFPNVYSNKEATRIHTRKYVGTVVCLENYHYYIPMSSPKESDYQIAGEKKVIKKSIVPIMRIVVKNSKGQKELKGTLRISRIKKAMKCLNQALHSFFKADNGNRNLRFYPVFMVFLHENRLF